MNNAGWIWYALLTATGVVILFRLFVLSKQVKDANKNYRKAAAASRTRSDVHAPGAPVVVYAVKADDKTSLSPVSVAPSNPRDAGITRALPLALQDDDTAQTLVADIKNKNVRYLLVNGAYYRVKHGGWAKRTDHDVDNMYATLWLLDPDPGSNAPLGTPGVISSGLDLVGDKNGVALCYILGM